MYQIFYLFFHYSFIQCYQRIRQRPYFYSTYHLPPPCLGFFKHFLNISYVRHKQERAKWASLHVVQKHSLSPYLLSLHAYILFSWSNVHSFLLFQTIYTISLCPHCQINAAFRSTNNLFILPACFEIHFLARWLEIHVVFTASTFSETSLPIRQQQQLSCKSWMLCLETWSPCSFYLPLYLPFYKLDILIRSLHSVVDHVPFTSHSVNLLISLLPRSVP